MTMPPGTSPSQLDSTHHFVLKTFVDRGYAPHFSEIARHFGVPIEKGKALLHDLMKTGMPMWLYPGTDLIASFAPFNNLPNQYRVTVNGRPGWFAQCGVEAMALCWLFPDKSVQIDSPCLDCGESLRVVVRDGVIESRDPDGIVVYVELPLNRWSRDWPLT